MSTNDIKFATHLLLYNQDKWILKNIEMIAPFVDKIYVAWSEFPWTYNPNARSKFKNTSNPEILKQSPFYDKIKLIEGNWNLDEDQRNACLNTAKQDGMDYLLIIDADEFYFINDIKNMLHDIKNNPDYDYYITPWLCFWKSFQYVVQSQNNGIIGNPEIAVNLNKNLTFVRSRRANGNKIKQLNYLCYHASYVLSDEECWSKINTWSHAHQFEPINWFNNKWKNWNLNTTNLHPSCFSAWYKAVEFKGELPEILKEYYEQK
jgi:hypothetical protein